MFISVYDGKPIVRMACGTGTERYVEVNLLRI